jgi:hypothetical protein
MNLAEKFREDRRLVLLRILAEAPGYSANESILYAMIEDFGHVVSRDVVRSDLAWLAEQELVRLEEIATVYVVHITARGQDCASGRAVVPGVKKPSPR